MFIAAMVAICWMDARASTPGAWLIPLAMVVAVLGTQEMLGMMRSTDLCPAATVVYVFNVLIVYASWHTNGAGAALTVFSLGLIAAFVAEMRRYTGPGGVTQRLAASALVMAYVGALLAMVVQVRLISLAALAALVIVVKLCDIGAYTVGRLIGRHKMTPILSPGKTWEGAVGGVAFGCFGAWLSLVLLGPSLGAPSTMSVVQWLSFGIVVSIAGIIGDLAESLLKRDLGHKDSSAWMPGFGGVLDIIDSILVAAPVAFFWWQLAENL